MSKNQPARIGQHQWDQIGKVAKQGQHHIGKPGPGQSSEILDMSAVATLRPTRVAWGIGEQRNQDIGSNEQRKKQGPLSQTTLQVIGQRCAVGFLLCLGQFLNYRINLLM